MSSLSPRRLWTLALVCAVILITACTSRPRSPIPMEDRGTGQGPAVPRPAKPAAAPSAQTPAAAPQPAPTAVSTPVNMGGSDNAGKPGYYTVKQGDTLTRIALDHGQAWRDVARWNGLDNPNLIEVDQVLRVAPPNAPLAPAPVGAPGLPNASMAAAKPGAASPPSLPSTGAVTPTPAKPVGAAAQTAQASPAAQAFNSDEALSFAWPASGPLLSGFDEIKNKGLDIGGAAADPVLAAADGKVVYAGAGLRGYGNLIILKHNNTFLTAYAHNQTLLVKEDQTIQKGQKIAEMGNSDADRVKLHFEIRRLGKPVDPAKLLPPR